MTQNEYFIELRPDPTSSVALDANYVHRGTGVPMELLCETFPVAPIASGVFAFYNDVIQNPDKPVDGAETRRAADPQTTTTHISLQALIPSSSTEQLPKPDSVMSFDPIPGFIGSTLSPISPVEQQSWKWNVEMLSVNSQAEALANPMASWIHEDAGNGLFRLRSPLDNDDVDKLYLCASPSSAIPRKMIILPSSQVPRDSSYFTLDPVQGKSGSRP